MKRPYSYSSEVLLKSIAKSCPKIKSLTIIFDTTEDLSLFEHLLLSCNELESLTLMSINYLVQSLLEKQLRKIDENWNFNNHGSEFMEYGSRRIECSKWIEFNKFHSSHAD